MEHGCRTQANWRESREFEGCAKSWTSRLNLNLRRRVDLCLDARHAFIRLTSCFVPSRSWFDYERQPWRPPSPCATHSRTPNSPLSTHTHAQSHIPAKQSKKCTNSSERLSGRYLSALRRRIGPSSPPGMVLCNVGSSSSILFPSQPE
jgi:hypothetical protein